jgi:hypothetical protein
MFTVSPYHLDKTGQQLFTRRLLLYGIWWLLVWHYCTIVSEEPLIPIMSHCIITTTGISNVTILIKRDITLELRFLCHLKLEIILKGVYNICLMIFTL